MRNGIAMVLAAALLAGTATGAEAQWRDGYAERRPDPRPAAWVGVHFVGGDPVGEFGEVVGQGFGLDLSGSFPVVEGGALRLRTEAGFLVYGHERRSVCFPVPVGCRIGLDLTTSNTIFHMGAGPELALPGGAVEPYLHATAGFSYFATTSSLSGDHEHDSWAETRNFSDFVGAFTAGGGVRAKMKGGRTPIHLDVGVTYHRNGVAEYLREGDIVDEPDGSITIYPNRSEANLVAYRVGVSVGIPRGDDHRDRRRR